MKIESMRKEIRELRKSVIWKHEPICKAFIFDADDSSTEAEIAAYVEVHPKTHIIRLYRKDCGSGGLE